MPVSAPVAENPWLALETGQPRGAGGAAGRASFHERRPVHPGRLDAWLRTLGRGRVRGGGCSWVAAAPGGAAHRADGVPAFAWPAPEAR